mgnify:CR=1 FL=1
MLFAAGFGTRMGALTEARPKPMIAVAGKPLIDHALELVEAFEPGRVVVNLHYKPDMLERHLAGRGILFSHERPEILETGGGLRKALPLLGSGPVFTMNTDAVWRGPNPLALLAQAWDPEGMDALLLCVAPDHANGHEGKGDFVIDTNGGARRGPGLIYTGVQILKTQDLKAIEAERFSLNLIWDKMLKRGRLHALTYPGDWCDVGRPEGIGIAETMLGDKDV